MSSMLVWLHLTLHLHCLSTCKMYLVDPHNSKWAKILFEIEILLSYNQYAKTSNRIHTLSLPLHMSLIMQFTPKFVFNFYK